MMHRTIPSPKTKLTLLLDGVFTPSITFIITKTLNISFINGTDIHPIRIVYNSPWMTKYTREHQTISV